MYAITLVRLFSAVACSKDKDEVLDRFSKLNLNEKNTVKENKKSHAEPKKDIETKNDNEVGEDNESEEEEKLTKEGYYIHIDILHSKAAPGKKSAKAPRQINRFMVSNDAFDPRRATNFPSDLLEPDDKVTWIKKRELAGVGSDGYYELWKVPEEFSLEGFGNMIEQLQNDGEEVCVQMVRIIDNDHELIKFGGVVPDKDQKQDLNKAPEKAKFPIS